MGHPAIADASVHAALERELVVAGKLDPPNRAGLVVGGSPWVNRTGCPPQAAAMTRDERQIVAAQGPRLRATTRD
jgi:hypothetical protein